MRKRDRVNWQEGDARRAIARLEMSGESAAAYERRSGVPASRIGWWRKQLRERELGTTSLAAMLPVRVTASDEARVERSGLAVFEIVIGSRMVRVPAAFDEDALARLLRTVESA